VNIDLERQLKDWTGPTRTGRRLKVGGQRVRNLVKDGRLDAIRTDLGLLIDPRSVERYEQERAESGGK
jgi:hypothetical protein